MATVPFSIEGIEGVIQSLNTLDVEIRTKSGVTGLRKAGQIIAREARQNAPVRSGGAVKRSGKMRAPGTLKKSLQLKKLNRDYPAYVLRVRDPLGHLKEFGHATRAGKKVKRNIFSRARKARFKSGAKKFVAGTGYMTKAIESKRDRAFSKLVSELQKAL